MISARPQIHGDNPELALIGVSLRSLSSSSLARGGLVRVAVHEAR